MNTIVEVLVDLDNGQSTEVVAKIVEVKQTTYVVKYLSPTKKLFEDRSIIYKYEKERYEIDKECVSGFFDSTNEEDAGFIHLESGGWILADGSGGESDEYVPSGSGSDTDESVSLTESGDEINPE
jgi:hypothetical protein